MAGQRYKISLGVLKNTSSECSGRMKYLNSTVK